ncbi:hypothetical protein L3Q82_005160 [Scortum barcoo]|uniref:Uncharacterized protein n=1 Tax=Scortum barcoo TaxID=214431 RepID=A0ACB8V979_9TELE|nr:hypothetical protein L3Q82_005160 [Scortum barcoo]
MKQVQTRQIWVDTQTNKGNKGRGPIIYSVGDGEVETCEETNRGQNDLQRATGVNVSTQTIRNRLHEGGLRARRPVVGPVLTAQHRGARLAFAEEHQNLQVRHWRPVLFTDESRFTLSTCDRRERVWRRQGERYAACNVVQHDRFGGGSVIVWGGISMEGRTDLYCLGNGSLTAISRTELFTKIRDGSAYEHNITNSGPRTQGPAGQTAAPEDTGLAQCCPPDRGQEEAVCAEAEEGQTGRTASQAKG